MKIRVPISLAAALFCGVACSSLPGDGVKKQSQRTTVILLDCTESFEELFPEACSAVGRVIEGLPPGVVHVLGMTGEDPVVLIQDYLIPVDPSPLREQFYGSKAQFLKLWTEKFRELRPNHKRSNIFFGLWHASLLFQSTQRQKELIVLSDLRHFTRSINMERVKEVERERILDALRQQQLLPTLQNVDVHCLGVHLQNKTPRYWQSLKDFYTNYFAETGAELRTFRPDFLMN